MNNAIIKFHVRSIARHAKGLIKNMLGLQEPINIEHTTAAWHAPTDSSHPSLLCRCPETDGEVPYDGHLPGCQWKEKMCTSCEGTGHCFSCGGDGCRSDYLVRPLSPWVPSHDGLLLMDNGCALEGYVEVQADAESENFCDDDHAAAWLSNEAGFPGEAYWQMSASSEPPYLIRLRAGLESPDGYLCTVVPRHVAVARYGEEQVP